MRRNFSERRQDEQVSPYSRQPPMSNNYGMGDYLVEERRFATREPLSRGDEVLEEVLRREPRLGSVIAELMENPSNGDGYALVRAMVHTFGSDIYNALEDDNMLREVANHSYREYQKRQELERAYEEQLGYWEQSMQDIDAFAVTHRMSEDDMTELLNTIYESAGKIAASQIDTPLLEMFYHSKVYAKDLLEAEERGRINGRNEQIELRKGREQYPDALPQLASQRPSITLTPRNDSHRSNLELGNYQPARRIR